MVDKKEFLENLKLTQSYCDEKLKDSSKSLASILRTINPIINEKQIFDYESEYFDFLNASLTLTKWNLTEKQYYTDVVPSLYNKQLNTKKEYNKTSPTEFNGRILVSDYECSVTDGASEVEAKGLIDIHDLTPIDTWIYIDNKNGLLYSWIPEKYVDLINNAVLVNCVDILKWMDTDYKELYTSIFDKEPIIEKVTTDSLSSDNLEGDSRKSFWSIFKKRKN